jgi:Transposase
VPGRKTDVKDCEWISDLARYGLIAPGFVPPRPIRALRELSRDRRKLTQMQSGERNRLIKLLEPAGIKLASVASDVFGVSGRAMIEALIAGQDTAECVAGLARGQLRRNSRRWPARWMQRCSRIRGSCCEPSWPASSRRRPRSTSNCAPCSSHTSPTSPC